MGPAHGHYVVTTCWCRLTKFAATNGHRDELHFEGMQDFIPTHSQAGRIDWNATFAFLLRIDHTKELVGQIGHFLTIPFQGFTADSNLPVMSDLITDELDPWDS